MRTGTRQPHPNICMIRGEKRSRSGTRSRTGRESERHNQSRHAKPRRDTRAAQPHSAVSRDETERRNQTHRIARRADEERERPDRPSVVSCELCSLNRERFPVLCLCSLPALRSISGTLVSFVSPFATPYATSRPQLQHSRTEEMHTLSRFLLTGTVPDHSTFTMNYRSRRETHVDVTPTLKTLDQETRHLSVLGAPKCKRIGAHRHTT